MASIFSTISWLVVLPSLFALAYLVIELIAGIFPSRSTDRTSAPHRDIAFLVPAHNEEAVVGETIRDLKDKEPESRILVVADNCSDQTAAVARDAGAEVVERFDADRRGKGFALAFGREHLASNPPEIVMIVDADCRVAEGFSATMGAAISAKGKPVQASNLFRPDLGLPTTLQVSNFAMLVKNLFRMRGMHRLGGTVALLGTGMGFPWSDFERLQLATEDATEDLKLTVDLLSRKGSVAFEGRAQVWSSAETVEDTVDQRKRWEHGFLRHSLRYAIPVLAKGIFAFSRSRLALGLHLLVPPLALLMVLSLASALLALLLHLAGGSIYPVAALGAAIAMAGIVLGIAWLLKGREYLSLKALLLLPVYVLWKVPIYLGFITKRESSWGQRP